MWQSLSENIKLKIFIPTEVIFTKVLIIKKIPNGIIYKIQEAAGNKLDVKVVYVDGIPRTKRGKYRFLIQKIPIKFGDY